MWWRAGFPENCQIAIVLHVTPKFKQDLGIRKMQITPSTESSSAALIWNLDGSCEYFGKSLTKEQIADVRKMFTGDTLMEQLGMARYAGFI